MTGETFLVIGNGYWAIGESVQIAKQKFTRLGGKLANGYDVVTFEPGTQFKGVDFVGSARYIGNAPTVVTTPARKVPIKR